MQDQARMSSEGGTPGFENSPFIVERIKERLGHPPDLDVKQFNVTRTLKAYCLFITTLANIEKIETNILRLFTETQFEEPVSEEEFISELWNTIPLAPADVIADFDTYVNALLEGDCLVIFPNIMQVMRFKVSDPAKRSVSEPQSESTIRGPHEAFTEDVHMNMSLIRKRVKSADLRWESFTLGTTTHTNAVIVYLQDLAPAEVVSEFRSRIQVIRTDSIMDGTNVEEWIQDKKISPFPTLLSTERPDIIASHVLEGRVAVVVDGSPIALMGPATFMQFFISPEDYYQRADIATLLRWLRMLSFLLAVFVPALFVSVITFHHELLPNPLLINIATQREGVPFPIIMEAMLMLVTFEILREAGLRMPRAAGQAISIVGALVLGEAAVQAGLVSAAMIIVVSITAISNFVSPSYSFGIAQRILQFSYLLLGGCMGLFGILCGVLFTVAHLASLESFGVPYLAPIAPTIISDWKDILVRAPIPWMKTYPKMNHTRKKKR